MQFSTFVSVVAALGLSASVAAIPEPAVRDISDMQKRAATECGMNEHQPERCPEGAECNCVIQNMTPFPNPPNYFYYCVEAGCQGCDCPER